MYYLGEFCISGSNLVYLKNCFGELLLRYYGKTIRGCAMNKPNMEDYDLLESDFDTYKNQLKAYCKKEKERTEVAKMFIKFAMALVGIAAVIALVFLCVSDIDLVLIGVPFCIVFVIELPLGIVLNDYDSRTRINHRLYDKIVNADLARRISAYNHALQRYQEEYKRKTIDFWQSLSGYQFEIEMAKLYEKLGYVATVTKASGDGGVDIILKKNNEHIAVQCKHHNNPVGPNDVRALMGVVAAQNFAYGIFVSLNGFTQSVRSEVQKSLVTVQLVSLPDILEMAQAVSSDNNEYAVA